MMNYFLWSLGIHVLCLVFLDMPPRLNTSPSSSKVEVNILEGSRKANEAPILPKSSPSHNYAKTLGANSKLKKEQKIDMTDYGNKLKAKVDPVFVSKNAGQFPHGLSALIGFYPKENGEITNIRVLKSSGNKGFDRMCVDTLLEVGFIPPPPASLTVSGIEWTFGI